MLDVHCAQLFMKNANVLFLHEIVSLLCTAEELEEMKKLYERL